MDRNFYQELAAAGLRMPIGTELILREQPDPEAVLLNGPRLGRVYQEAARRFRTPLAMALMDLAMDKRIMLELLGVPAGSADQYHFAECPPEEALATIDRPWDSPPHPRMRAQTDAIRYVAENTDLVPMGMTIGPFS